MGKAAERVRAVEAAIEKLKAENEKKIAQARARIQKIKAREAAVERRKVRSKEQHQKFLLGAFILAQMKKTNTSPEMLSFGGVRFVDYLNRPYDRAFFGLSALK